jgi:spore germination protein
MVKIFFGIVCSLIIGIGVGIGYQKLRVTPPQELVSPLSTYLSHTQKRVVGFLPYWLLDKATDDYSKYLTELSYFSLTLNGDGSIQTKVNALEEEPGWTTLKKASVRNRLLQAHADGLVTSLVLFSSDNDAIGELISSPSANARTLISNITGIMDDYQFGDVNLDIESMSIASESARENFIIFLREFKNGLAKSKIGSLTIDITVASLLQRHLIDAKEAAKIADRVVLMTYDYHYPGSIITGPIAPLYGYPEFRPNDVATSIKIALQYIPKDKLIMGIPLYGYEWETIASNSGAPVIPGTGQTVSDRRAEQTIADCPNCIHAVDPVSLEPYIIASEGAYFNQMYYTDEASIQKRLELTKEMGLPGVALWALGYEGNTTLRPLTDYKRFNLLGN